ncbi:hypothetical protein ACFRAR_16565 [Kitasatospora sp. NPDC056651]|uniref:hypothetical protein n=1 Tax=Kitasatospora sp. NPDC056651 TaxID=3345892 RepID=UPI0036B74300
MAGNSMLNDPVVVQQVLTTVESQQAHMQQTQQQINAIVDEINTYFQAAAGTVFVQKMQDWQNKYKQVQEKYAGFHELLAGGSGLIQQEGQVAVQVVSGLGAGEDVLKGLS